MRNPELSLRVRIFLFFAFLMIASIVIIASAIFMAYQSTPEQLPRLLATYTGVAAVFIVLVLVLVWQLFDRYVAAALQSLARQMQTSMHADILEGNKGLKAQEAYQYLGSVSEAADELIQAYQTLKSEQGGSAVESKAHAIQTRQLAAILRDLDVGVMVMNRQHEILLYNQQAFKAINRPECLGLARSALLLFDEAELLAGASQIVEQSTEPELKTVINISLKLANESRYLTAKIGPVFNDNSHISGYVLLFGDPLNWSLSQPVQHAASVVASSLSSVSMSGLPSRPEFYDLDLFNRSLPENVEHHPLQSMDYVVFDTETTGLNPSGGDQMISIAAVRIVNGRVLTGECFDELIHPGKSVPARSMVFHGITDDMLVGKPSIKTILPQFAEFVGDAVLVAHNAAFDMKFIELQSEYCKVRLDNPVLDTVLLSAFVHDHTNEHTLDDLAVRYGVCIQGRHTALGDALATAHVFVKLVKHLSCRNIYTLSEAIDASNKMTRIKRQQTAY